MEVVRRVVEIFSRWTLASECFDPEVEYTTQPDAPMHTTYKGLDGLARSMESLKEVWESIETEVREFIGTGDVLVALLQLMVVVGKYCSYRAYGTRADWIRDSP